MTVGDPLSASAFELAAAIREGALSSRAIVEAHIERAKTINPTINAIVVPRYEQALREADEADAARAVCDDLDELPPLHGVPCTIKESFAFTGLPNTSGLVSRRGAVAEVDATTVARLRAAGAICIGLTNVSELCMWMESSNHVYGRSNNPYDPRCIVGGSSGGEGAIVGAGASPFGLGADIGGSIRMPAFFCGAFGHKPTGGVVPATGQYPIAENAALGYLSTGPIARRASDLLPLLRILAGPDGEDPSTRRVALEDRPPEDLRGLDVVVVENDGKGPVDHELVEALERAASALADRGARIERARIPEFGRAFELWSALMAEAAQVSFREHMGLPERGALGRELVRWTVGRSPHTLPALVLAAMEDARPFVPSAAGRQRMLREVEALRRRVVQLIGPRGVMLYPPHPRPAPRHGSPLLRPFDFAYTAVFNILELPVTQVPMGLSRQGLPLGVQVVGVHDNDALTIAVGEALEDAIGGWVRPAA